jgi:hypothetical protein
MPVFTVMRERLPHDRFPRAVRVSLILGARTYCVSSAMHITKVLELSNLNRKVRNCAIFWVSRQLQSRIVLKLQSRKAGLTVFAWVN